MQLTPLPLQGACLLVGAKLLSDGGARFVDAWSFGPSEETRGSVEAGDDGHLETSPGDPDAVREARHAQIPAYGSVASLARSA